MLNSQMIKMPVETHEKLNVESQIILKIMLNFKLC